MTCARFAGARVLEAYDESAGELHIASCGSCEAEVREMREVRRVYAEGRPLSLNSRRKRAIVSMIRRERNQGRLRSAIATIAGFAAAVLLLAGVGGTPMVVSAAEAGPAGWVIDSGLVEVRTRLADLEIEERSYFDSTLDDLKARVGSLSWDAENM